MDKEEHSLMSKYKQLCTYCYTGFLPIDMRLLSKYDWSPSNNREDIRYICLECDMRRLMNGRS